MSATLKIGGPLAIRCQKCGSLPRRLCTSRSGKPHLARTIAAPSEQVVKVGDLVIVSSPIPGAPDGREDLAAIHDIPARCDGIVSLRFAFSLMARWWFADPQPIARERILRLAPENAQTAAMRATLAAEGRAA